jgi:hypothetical protein
MTTTQPASQPKTIARTATRKVAALSAALKTCHSYSLDRGFIAEQIAAEWGWDQHSRGHGKLTDNGDGTATLAFHGNFWLKYSA